MDIEEQLRAALAPRRPRPELRAGILSRVAGIAGSTRRVPRSGSRTILFGTILVAAAAAAMLAILLRDEPAPQVVAAVPGVAPAIAPAAEVQDEQILEEAAAPATRQVKEELKERVLPVEPYTVQVLPLQYGAEGVPKMAAKALQGSSGTR